ncbi:MAG: hypothetical protein LBU32_06145 [Clostridiales bacterium]|nr:hypothetical protein [Clostridiales bacterium]
MCARWTAGKYPQAQAIRSSSLCSSELPFQQREEKEGRGRIPLLPIVI